MNSPTAASGVTDSDRWPVRRAACAESINPEKKRRLYSDHSWDCAAIIIAPWKEIGWTTICKLLAIFNFGDCKTNSGSETYHEAERIQRRWSYLVKHCGTSHFDVDSVMGLKRKLLNCILFLTRYPWSHVFEMASAVVMDTKRQRNHGHKLTDFFWRQFWSECKVTVMC